MSAQSNIFTSRQKLGGPFAIACSLHVLLVALCIGIPLLMHLHNGSDWGDQNAVSGDAMGATLVSSIPLPANPNATNVMATDNKGQTVTEAPKPEPVQPNAIKIPDRDAKVKPNEKTQSTSHTTTPTTPIKPQTPPDKRVPFGEGGPVSGPYGVFTASNAKGGLSIAGSDFGSRYAWYVKQMREKISQNWLRYQVGASISGAKRVYISFDIARDGSPSSIRVEQGSGVPMLDRSALQALQRIDSFGPLPQDYRGNRVSVEFWFDLGR